MLAKLELPTTILCSFMMPKTKCFSFEEKLHIIKFAKKNPNYGTRKPAEILYWGKTKIQNSISAKRGYTN